MQSTLEHFPPTGVASPWQLKRTSREATNLISYHDKISPVEVFLNSITAFDEVRLWFPHAKRPEPETLVQI